MPDPDPTVDPAAPAADPTTDPVTDPAVGDGDEPLGPAGVKALEAMKAERAELKRQKQELQAELDAARLAQMDDQERAIEEARNAGRQEANASVQAKLFAAELKAAAASQLSEQALKDLLASPDVAKTLLGLGEIPVTSDGDIDSEAISQAVASYVEERPYLAASATRTPGPVDQGARTPTTTVKTLDEQIAEAEAAGNWTLSRQLKVQKQFAAS